MNTPLTYPTLIPSLTVNEAAAAIDFYKRAFEAEERYRLTDPVSHKIGHCELMVFGQLVMLSDEFPGMNHSPQTLGGTTSQLILMVPDPDAAFEKAIQAGATSLRAPTDEFYGYRSCLIQDPCGQQWMLQREIEKLSPEDVQQRWEAMLADASCCQPTGKDRSE